MWDFNDRVIIHNADIIKHTFRNLYQFYIDELYLSEQAYSIDLTNSTKP